MIGTSVPRLDGVSKLTGQVSYTINLQVSRMLHAKILRSKVPHARLLRVDASRALKEPGVVTVLTGAELQRLSRSPYYGPVFRDQPVVGIDRVRYAGDPIAAVAAVDEETAEPVPVAETNICSVYRVDHGDLEQGFREAAHVFEHTFTCPTTQHCPMEPHAAIAQPDADGRLTVWSSTQSPFVVRAQLAELLDWPLSRVRVIAPPLGGGYGAKLFPKTEPIAVCLALLAGRPVKVVLTREEVFLTLTKHAAKVTIRTGVARDGRLLARHARILWDTGAYAENGPRVCKNGGYASLGPYRIPHLKAESYCVYTNKPPAGSFRGFGVSQVAWAGESQMDLIARELGRDPLELRRQNLLQEGDRFHTGDV
ncbi:MAG: xanthine dehydrogenase family protein, partial [Deltaproteobacteria bacterium]|nr:xanthine dehydrogenase family protein [Deltaproteobacteria bacterium]